MSAYRTFNKFRRPAHSFCRLYKEHVPRLVCPFEVQRSLSDVRLQTDIIGFIDESSIYNSGFNGCVADFRRNCWACIPRHLANSRSPGTMFFALHETAQAMCSLEDCPPLKKNDSYCWKRDYRETPTTMRGEGHGHQSTQSVHSPSWRCTIFCGTNSQRIFCVEDCECLLQGGCFLCSQLLSWTELARKQRIAV